MIKIGYGVKLLVEGDYACFTRPEIKAERYSYDILTPSAARGILEAIYWHPQIKWVVDKIHVLNEIRFDNIKRNEVKKKIPTISKAALKGNKEIKVLDTSITDNRTQRTTAMLRNVKYVIEAHFELKDPNADEKKAYAMFCERARSGQCFYQPYLGFKEFAAHFRLIEEGEKVPKSFYADEKEIDFGFMLHDLIYEKDRRKSKPRVFRAIMKNGIVEVPAFKGGE